jgi:hypothetical protein
MKSLFRRKQTLVRRAHSSQFEMERKRTDAVPVLPTNILEDDPPSTGRELNREAAEKASKESST